MRTKYVALVFVATGCGPAATQGVTQDPNVQNSATRTYNCEVDLPTDTTGTAEIYHVQYVLEKSDAERKATLTATGVTTGTVKTDSRTYSAAEDYSDRLNPGGTAWVNIDGRWLVAFSNAVSGGYSMEARRYTAAPDDPNSRTAGVARNVTCVLK